eukprot:TRINITY_DN8690_c0_g1_i1.p1 TRINITY_DN8690_c0_g1~~TRINITY_DN8690_c0_g1_i1.p1  ORF type:complete len:416 (-),score=94.57 TRINITY_DN8690_c0_g1_i1:392-1639(-)
MDEVQDHQEVASFHYSDADGDGEISLEDARTRWRNYGLSDRRIEEVWQRVAQLGTGRKGGITFRAFNEGFEEIWRPIEQEGMERYQKIKTIGRGAHGVVRLVKTRDGGHAVMKKVDLTSLGDKQRHSALQEIQLLYRLEHPAIISYHEAFVFEGHLMIAMDYAAGGDLQGRVSAQKKLGQPFPEPVVLEWFSQVLMALQFIHGHKVVHRDLKAGNVFLTDAGRIKLGDFGIARVLGGTHEMASTVVGTPYYLAPEIIESKPYSTPADMWSAGVLLFEMAALELPFQATNMPALMLRIVFRKMEQLPKHVSSTISELVTMLLDLAPLHRPSASQLLELDVLASVSRALTAPPPPSPWRAHRISSAGVGVSPIVGRSKPQGLSPMGGALESPQSSPGAEQWNHRKPLPSLDPQVCQI